MFTIIILAVHKELEMEKRMNEKKVLIAEERFRLKREIEGGEIEKE